MSVGKRLSEELIGRAVSPSPNFSTIELPLNNTKFLDFIFLHAQGDERPYLEVSILGLKMLGLLDSGASRTIVGQSGYVILQNLGLQLVRKHSNCTVANGQVCASIGFISAPITLMNKTHFVEVLVLPELSHQLILGVDFWKAMKLIPDLQQDVWHFADSLPQTEVCGVVDAELLSDLDRQALDKFVKERVFSSGTGLGCCKVAEHVIELLPGTLPIKQRYYPVSPFKQRLIDEEIDEMLKLGVIEPSKSPWSSPVCLVKKKDNSYRFCIDFRKLNSKTKKDSYPIPYISAILDRLKNAHYISSIDIKSAFWQVPLSEASKELTAFTVPGRNLFQFTRMPFGLTNAPATWQRIIDRVLGVDLENNVMVYLDDIIIISSTFNEHLKILGLVFDRLKDAGLLVKPEKCHFCKPELKYLGHVVDSKGLRPDPEKVQAIVNILPPTNLTEIRRFIATASWYRRFIPSFSSILSPLSHLTRKNVKFNWTPECQSSFNTLKEALITAPVLTCPDFDKTFVLQTDASHYGLGAVLTQSFVDGEKVICYLSRSLTRQEMKLTVTEKECLAVIWGVEKLRHYLEGVHFKVITDHHSLLWLHNLKDPQGRLARWALRLQPYDFQLIHRKGKEHIVPDFLSRSVPVSVSAALISDQALLETQDAWYRGMLHRIEQHPNKFPCWRVEGGKLYKFVKTSNPDFLENSSSWKLVVPKDSRKEILSRCHDLPTSGHVGMFKTFWRIAERYYWPKLRSDVHKYISHCHICAQNKVEQKPPAGLMGNRPVVNQPWQSISLDFVGPLVRSKSGNSHILVVTDYFSKYVVTHPCRSANAKTLTRFLENNVFLVYGAPQTLTCDNGTPMRSGDFRALCDKYKVNIFFTAAYYPRADHTERVNRVIKTMLKTYVDQGNHRTWEDNLPAISCAIRTSRHETTGYTPYFINFGREHKLFGQDFTEGIPTVDTELQQIVTKRIQGFKDMFLKVSERILKSRDKSQHLYNLRRRPVSYFVGQRVWKKNKSLSNAANYFSAKLAPEFVGPFIIHKRTGTCTYELKDSNGVSKGVWHVQDLKPVVE